MLTRQLWALAAGLAIGLAAILVSRWLDRPWLGWSLLLGLLVVAYLGARMRQRR